MRASINIPSADKIKVLCLLRFGGCSDLEVAILSELVANNEGLAVDMDKYLSGGIKSSLKAGKSSFNTAVHRMSKRGIIKKSGRTIFLHPIFGAAKCDDLLLVFKD